MVKILLSNVGGTDNMGIVLMIKALVSSVDAEFYVHQFTVCRDYRKYGINYTWKPFGFDVALDLGGDTFTTYYGNLQFLRHCVHLFMHILFRQRFCLFAQTFSPYNRFTKRLALFFMKRACLITVREQRSFDLLKSMGVKCHLTADVAFLLDSCNSSQYFGGSYHKVIAAKLSGCSGVWDGSRAENFKFDIFKEPLDLEVMRKKAGDNIVLLERLLSD